MDRRGRGDRARGPRRARARAGSWRPTAASSASYGSRSHTGARRRRRRRFGDDVLAEPEVAGRPRSRSTPCVSSSFAITASWSFSHTRGTAKNTVGRQSRRSSATVERLRANHVSAPTATAAKSLIIRSAMWLSGRNERSRSRSPISTNDDRALDRPHDVGVADHRALGRAGRAARVDERGELLGRHRAGAHRRTDRARARAAPRRSSRSCVEAEHERVVETLVVFEHDDAGRASAARPAPRGPRTASSWSSTKQTLASALPRRYATCSAELVWYTGTVTLPLARVPRSAMCHSARLFEKMPDLLAGARCPSSANPAVTSATARP